MFSNKDIDKIKRILESEYTDIEVSQVHDDHIVFEGYSDALMEIKVEKKSENKLAIYDRYVAEKHYVHFKNVDIDLEENELIEN